MVKRTWKCFTETVLANRAKARMIQMLKRQMFGYKFRQRKVGGTIDDRNLRNIRDSITFQCMFKSISERKGIVKALRPYFKLVI